MLNFSGVAAVLGKTEHQHRAIYDHQAYALLADERLGFFAQLIHYGSARMGDASKPADFILWGLVCQRGYRTCTFTSNDDKYCQ
jgi:hypothetical protein